MSDQSIQDRMSADWQTSGDGERVSSWRARLIRALLRHLRHGRLTVVTPEGERVVCGHASDGPDATLVLHRWRTVRRCITGGDVAFGEAYIDGDWSSPDLATVIEMFASNDESLRRNVSGFVATRLVNQLRHAVNRNSRPGSRRNILAHYDLGNRFYEQWLDSGMTYSSGVFTEAAQTLEDAQSAKLDAVVAALDLRGGERIVEIGCGWGGLAERLAREGCHVTAVTLSPSQLAYAQARIAAAGLADRVTFVLQDYRDIVGRFDRVVSIEMIEAVGIAYLPTYFRRLKELLEPNGTAVLQAITISDLRFPFYARTPDFIQRYVFPGGMLPSPSLMQSLSQSVGLTLSDPMLFGTSYARTLSEWGHRFKGAWPNIQPLGFDAAFQRLWTYYLAYCEGAFRSGAIDVGLYRLTPKPA